MITAAPNDFMKPIHHRMPAILREQDFSAWLDPESPLETLLKIIASRQWDEAQAAIDKLKPDKVETQDSLFSAQSGKDPPDDSPDPEKDRE
jgi:putative SOS response-associated peptidase YedK